MYTCGLKAETCDIKKNSSEVHFTTNNSTEANRKGKGKEINNEAQAAPLPPQLDSLKVVCGSRAHIVCRIRHPLPQ